ncbi:BMP family lipoprotein [Fervidibacillus albus]|uniref:BMP family protein n=1 Tax=Fervidibacillus albus TaxID=2980026 RepID=A0A9E8RWJ9_9BACI|nr:BMP family protein [Fervidibacillus albus]WAA10771.1 BMP family protein [Fervidibacillus albus]
MKKRNWFLLTLLLSLGFVLAACGGGDDESTDGEDSGDSEDNFTVAMVTDVGGVDDKSFNQSAWEGLQQFGADNGLEKGDNGYDYLQSNSDEDYVPNLNTLVRRDFDLIFGIGFMLAEPIEEIAQQQPDTNFGIVDMVVEQPNVASIMFKEQEVSFLAGVAAAMETNTKNVGFVGGMESDVIKRFEAGFRAGVASVDPTIEVQINYTGAFDRADLGQSAANQMYTAGADIIFHASGATGNGVFTEAKARKEQDPNANVWVIGVDSDQYDEGTVEVDGTEYNVTLTSALKRVDIAVQDIATKAMNGEFPGGETTTYGLADSGVQLAETGDHLSDETLEAVKEWEQKIIDGEVVPPSTQEEMEAFLEELGVEL